MPTITRTKTGFNIQHTTREVWGVDDDDATVHTAEEFAAALAGFLAASQKKVNERFAQYSGHQRGEIQTETGPKYIRVIDASFVNEQESSRSAFCFINRTTGDVLKPAGWKGPEKRNPRSNIFADDFGASGITGYGTTYLR
jgi:hypothetical protein